MADSVNELGWLNYVGELLPRLLPVDTWQSFCIQWGRSTSEEAAIGLLHAGPKLLRKELCVRGKNEANEIIAQAVNLYLRYAEEGEGHPDLARVAKQVLIGKIVRARLVDPGDTGLFRTHLALLRFLKLPDKDILRTPNPHAVLNYLIGLSWQWAGKQNPNPEMQVLLQPHGKLIIRTMLEWGWADYVEDDYQVPLVIETIREYLTDKRPDWTTAKGHRYLSHWMDYGRPDTEKFSLGEPNSEILAVSRAYAKLFEMAWTEAWSN